MVLVKAKNIRRGDVIQLEHHDLGIFTRHEVEEVILGDGRVCVVATDDFLRMMSFGKNSGSRTTHYREVYDVIDRRAWNQPKPSERDLPNNPLDVFLQDLKRRGRLANAPMRKRRKRVQKRINKRDLFLRFGLPSDKPPASIVKIAKTSIAVHEAITMSPEDIGPPRDGLEAAFLEAMKETS